MRKFNKRVYFQAMLITIVTITIVVSIFLSNYLTNQLFLERSYLLKEISEKSARLADNVVEASWDKMEYIMDILEEKEIKDKSQLMDMLNELSGELLSDNTHLIAVNGEGDIYSEKLDINNAKIDKKVLENNGISIAKLSYMDSQEYMLFIKELGNSISFPSEEITHIAIAIDHGIIEQMFNITAFSDKSVVYIIDENINEIYHHTANNQFIHNSTSEDISDYAIINGGSYEEFKKSISDRIIACIEFEFDETAYYVSSAPMIKENWTLLIYVPTEVLSAYTTSAVAGLSIYFIAVSIFGVIITIGLSTYIVNHINDKKMLEQKENNGKLLMEMAKEANSANIAKSNFISHMSHDIRTPINGIIGMTNIAKMHSDEPERVKECLDKISGSSNHLLSLINDVLDMSRIESGKVIVLNDPFNLNELIDNCVSIIDGHMEDIVYNLEVERGELPHLHLKGDELHTRQILINILGNAVKFTPKRGTITFRIEEEKSDDSNAWIKYTVSDTGIGMSEEFVKQIFEPFSQERVESRSNYTGTGLGMTITKKFVDLLGGTISVNSVLNEGTTFTVIIPYEIHEKKVEIEESVKEINVTGMKVLLVEDNDLNLEIAELMLEENGVEVVTAQDGQMAVDIYKENPPYTFDAILMDVMMPVMDGLVATRIIRCMRNKDSSSIPIIAMTANAYQEDIRKTKKAGMNEHISKPIDINLLLETLTKYNNKINSENN